MYNHNFPPNRADHSPRFPPYDGRFPSPRHTAEGPPGRGAFNPYPGGPPRRGFMPPPYGQRDFRGPSPRHHTPRRNFYSPNYQSPHNMRTPSPYNSDGFRGPRTPRSGRSRGRGNFKHNSNNCSIGDYFSPHMLTNPWAEFEETVMKPPCDTSLDSQAKNESASYSDSTTSGSALPSPTPAATDQSLS